MINSFSKFLVEEEKQVFFTFGRMNPPTIGHEKLLDKLAKTAGGKSPFRVYLSQSQDSKSNPLSYIDKVKIARKMFPRYGRNIMLNKKVKTVFDALTALYDEGFVNIAMVVGSDRVQEFDILIKKYNGVKGRHGFYNFRKINVISAGQRDPDAKGAEGASATKQREAAAANDFTAFSQGLPKAVSNSDAKKIFNLVRKGLGLKEEKEFKNHVQLEPVNNLRESYVNGELFKEGDQVVMKESGEIGTVKRLGSNYVIIEGSGNQYRKWLDAVERVEENNNAEHKSASFSQNFNEQVSLNEANMQRFKNFDEKNKGLWHNIHQRRKKGLPPKKPGEKGYPKTLDIEAVDQTDVAKKRIDREKMTDKIKHDRMLDRARMRDTVKKNKETK
jgi:hypothetical protein